MLFVSYRIMRNFCAIYASPNHHSAPRGMSKKTKTCTRLESNYSNFPIFAQFLRLRPTTPRPEEWEKKLKFTSVLKTMKTTTRRPEEWEKKLKFARVLKTITQIVRMFWASRTSAVSFLGARGAEPRNGQRQKTLHGSVSNDVIIGKLMNSHAALPNSKITQNTTRPSPNSMTCRAPAPRLRDISHSRSDSIPIHFSQLAARDALKLPHSISRTLTFDRSKCYSLVSA